MFYMGSRTFFQFFNSKAVQKGVFLKVVFGEDLKKICLETIKESISLLSSTEYCIVTIFSSKINDEINIGFACYMC